MAEIFLSKKQKEILRRYGLTVDSVWDIEIRCLGETMEWYRDLSFSECQSRWKFLSTNTGIAALLYSGGQKITYLDSNSLMQPRVGIDIPRRTETK